MIAVTFLLVSFCVSALEITYQFEIIDPLGRNKIRIYDNSVIENDFLNYDFEGYDLRSDQVIDFGTEPNQESLVFTTFQGEDWMDARRSHYFEVSYWRDTQSFEEMRKGPSWFATYHFNRADKYEQYFFTCLLYTSPSPRDS